MNNKTEILSLKKTGTIYRVFFIIITIILTGPAIQNVSAETPYVNYLKAVEKTRTGNYSEALISINKAVDSDPGNHEYLAYKGFILRNTAILKMRSDA
jgi:hypothetical protein